MVGCPWPDPAPTAPLPQSQYRTVIPSSSATHMQIFSLLACRWAGFLFWGFWPPGPPPWLFSPNAPTICHSHTISYPHANFQPPSMSLGWIFIFGPLAAPWLFSSNAPTNCPSHAISYPHAKFQHPSMSFGLIFILGVLAPWPAPLAFFAKRTHNLSFPYHQLPTCKFSAS